MAIPSVLHLLNPLQSVNLPFPILIHALGLSCIGLNIIFPGKWASKSSSPKKTQGKQTNGEDNPLFGVATLGLGLAYLFTSHMPIEENQFLQATVPVRILLGAVCLLKWWVGGCDEGMRKKLLYTGLYDGIGGAVLGLWLGKFW
ncbi:hypothetical protein BGZ60DRAFT_423937 [Tricladium varicosporioides]|nr:hypothetical protein BGZ60DRAFT_423937 [Hymenoscyphus varicosporioides]